MLEDERRCGRESAERQHLEVPRTSKPTATGEGHKCSQRRGEIEAAASRADGPLHAMRMKRPIVSLMADQATGQVGRGAEKRAFITDTVGRARRQKGWPQNRRRDKYSDHAELITPGRI